MCTWTPSTILIYPLDPIHQGYAVGGTPYIDPPQRIGEHLAQNMRYAEEDITLRGISHSLQLGAEVQDGYLNAGGEKQFAFVNRKSTPEGERTHAPRSRF